MDFAEEYFFPYKFQYVFRFLLSNNNFFLLLQFVALRNRIIETLCNYKGLRIVQTRLCVAMASVVIHSIPAQWKTPILEIISLFRGNSTLLFEVLTVVPEEFSTQVRSKLHKSCYYMSIISYRNEKL